jgi:glycosyltransferase involved in cell wall biosynthesis
MGDNWAFKPWKIGVVIPAYRAESRIAGVIRGIPDFVSLIVVVEDSSPDATAARVEKIAREDSRVHLIRHESNKGVGGAVLTGYRAAYELGAEIIVKMDSDGQMDPDFLIPLISPIMAGEADYAKGNRFLHSRQLKKMPLLRRIGNMGLSFFTKAASGYWNVFDPTNGYTAIHAWLVPMMNHEAIAKRFFFESSMFLELNLLHAVVRDVPIPAKYDDEKSNLSIFKTLFEFPVSLIGGFLRRIWIQYFVRDFSLTSFHIVAGGLLTTWGFGFGLFHWIRSMLHGAATPTGTVMLSILPILLGIQCLFQAIGLDVQNRPEQPLHVRLRSQSAAADALVKFPCEERGAGIIIAGSAENENIAA